MKRRFADRAAQTWLWVWIGGSIVGACTQISPHDLERALGSPSWLHPMGFDAFGRDLLAMTMRASALSMLFAAAATLAASFLAIILGAWIALAPPVARFTLSRGLEIFLAFPSLLLALAWAAVRGPSWDTLVFSLMLGSTPPLTRLMQARAREVATEDFVVAARSLGATAPRITQKHLIPELLSLLAIKAPNLFASAILAEATLSFLGVGAPIGQNTWGSLLAQGKDYLIEAPHLAIGAGIPLVLTVTALQRLKNSEPSPRA